MRHAPEGPRTQNWYSGCWPVSVALAVKVLLLGAAAAGLLGGVAVPLLVPWVHAYGVEGSGAQVLAALVTVAWLVRLVWLRESRAGRAAQHAHRAGVRLSIRHRIAEGAHGTLKTLAALRVLVRVPIAPFATLAPLVLVAGRAEALSPALLAYLPLAGSVAGGLVMLTHSRWHNQDPKHLLVVSLVLMTVGMGVLSLAPAGQVLPVMAAWALVAAGQAWFWSVHTPFWVASLPPVARVTVQGWTGAVPRLVARLGVLPVAAGLVLMLATPTLPAPLHGGGQAEA